jgi:DnaK suppressor protein
MTQNEMKTFQLILKEKGVEMTKALRNREGILIEKAADELDEITTALERDIAVQKLDRESRLLRQILGALSRIESGTFGTCLHCDDEISRKRQPEASGGRAMDAILPGLPGRGRPGRPASA